MQCGIGKPFNMPKYRLGITSLLFINNIEKLFFLNKDLCSAWVLLLPFYTIFMLPWTLCLVVYRCVEQTLTFFS